MTDRAPQLKISPTSTLEFELTGNQQQAILRLENPHQRCVAFKIKTTEPKSYLVKPSSGVINPQGTVSITIVLIPQANKEGNDRFLVQAVFTEEERALTKEEWNNYQGDAKDFVFERKLVVAKQVDRGAGGGASRAAPRANADASSRGKSTLPDFVYNATPDDEAELRRSYQQLVAYAIALDKKVQELELELDENQRNNAARAGAGKCDTTRPQGFQAWQVGFMMLVLLAFCYVLKLFPRGSSA